mgnify:FL=1
MLLNQLSVGTPVIIKIERNGFDKQISSKVESIKNGNVNLLAPMDGVKYIQLSKSEAIEVIAVINGGIIRWTCRLIQTNYKDIIPTITLHSDKPGITYNRRNAFRISVYRDITYECKGKLYKGILNNISILGVSILSKEKHKVGDIISFDIKLLNEMVNIKAQIIRHPIKVKDSDLIDYGAALFGKDNKLIRKYVYEVQRIQLQNRHKATS